MEECPLVEDYPVRLHTRGRVITLSVHPFVGLLACLFVCLFEDTNMSKVGMYLFRTSQKRENISFYVTSPAKVFFEELGKLFTTFLHYDYYHIFKETSGRSEFRLLYYFPCYVEL